jgi:hypothetical protein
MLSLTGGNGENGGEANQLTVFLGNAGLGREGGAILK